MVAIRLPAARIALDTNVLLDLAKGLPFAEDLRRSLLELGCELGFPPTVMQELAFLVTRQNVDVARYAVKALQSIRRWCISPWTLIPVGNAITEQFHHAIVKEGILPEQEKNDAFIIAETALAAVPFLVTSDQILCNVDGPRLCKTLSSSDLPMVTICHPKRILFLLRHRR